MTEWRSERDGKQWRNSSMGERATPSPAPEVIQWHNVVLGERDAACGVIDAKYMTERSEWMLKWAQWIKYETEQASVNKRERSERESSVRAERAPYLLTPSQYERSESWLA
jgi:hypothetical protein